MTENNKVKVKIVTKTGDVPKYETAGSAGMDLDFSNINPYGKTVNTYGIVH